MGGKERRCERVRVGLWLSVMLLTIGVCVCWLFFVVGGGGEGCQWSMDDTRKTGFGFVEQTM